MAGILLVDECRRGGRDPSEANPVVTIGRFQDGKLGEDPSSSLRAVHYSVPSEGSCMDVFLEELSWVCMGDQKIPLSGH